MIEAADGRPVVLLAEDEALTRIAAAAMLRAAGYRVVEAPSAPVAMLALEDTAGIGVLVTDIDLPQGFDGVTLAACVRCRWPAVGIVMVSGKVRPGPGDVPEGAYFFGKPYAEAEILAAVRALLARGNALGPDAPPA